MKEPIHIHSMGDIPVTGGCVREKINCVVLDCKDINNRFSSPVYIDALIAILVLSGTSDISINYRTHALRRGSLLLLSASHLFHLFHASNDFQCACLFVGKEFMEEMDSTDMIHKRIKYGVRLYNTPLLRLTDNEFTLVHHRIMDVANAIDNERHYYYKEMILNCLFAFYLDVSDIIERQTDTGSEGNLTRYESIIKSFIELLVQHYREEHKVAFYANHLHLSAHYLNQIVKQVTGQSITDFIFEMLYSDARTLLTHSKLSVQEIATLLHFSDQSSFGKFFKRKSGLSPLDYKRNR